MREQAPVIRLISDEARVRGVYGASVFLLRPDLHIVWRGDGAPTDPAGLAARATGWVGDGNRMADRADRTHEVPVP